ncbi:MAG: PHP domain-containing protein, partial [Bacilli bacterium]
MIKKDLHIHSSYCDGNDTVEDIIKYAISLQMETVGILTHSYT